MARSLATLIAAAGAAGAGASMLRTNKSDCECKNWMETYNSGAVSCGAGSEYYFFTSTSYPTQDDMLKSKQWEEMLCREFYQKLNMNSCVNVNMGHDKGQWCYVDDSCRDLNDGGKVPNSALSWKTCEAGKDAMLRSERMDGLVQISKDNDVWLALLHKMSFPGERAGEGGAHLWKEVMEDFGFNPEIGAWTPDYVPENRKMFVESIAHVKAEGLSHSFDTRTDGKVPHIVVQDGKIYMVEGDKVFNTPPGGWSTVTCIGNC